MLMYQ